MIEEIAHQEGIDLSDVQPLPKAPHNTLSHRAKAYVRAVDELLSKYELLFGACIDREERRIEAVTENSPTMAKTKARLETCTRQRILIALKVGRAFEQHEAAALDEVDADGSAKAALVAIDESISAWLDVAKAVDHPLARNELRGLLESLEQLRAQIERARPGARAFVRPGFDEQHFARGE